MVVGCGVRKAVARQHVWHKKRGNHFLQTRASSHSHSLERPAPIGEAQDSLAITFCHKPAPVALGLLRSTKDGVIVCSDDPALVLTSEKAAGIR